MADPIVTFDRVSKKYKTFQALKNLSFTLNEGEIFGYIGPNGAGKTTTLKLLVGLLMQFEGAIHIGRFTLPRDLMQVHRLVGYLPQDPEFQSWRTVDHALMTLGRLSGVSVHDLKLRIPALLERFNLGDVRYKKIKKLSGGMKQKVGFVQAMLHRPRLLVLDEPLNGLDPDSHIRLREQILAMKAEGTTVIFSSHILDDVQNVADRIGIIQGGRMLQAGTMAELARHFGVNREVHLDFSKVPGETRFLSGLRRVRDVKQRSDSFFVLEIENGAEVDEVVHEAVTASLGAGGRIRSVREYAPTLDELYKRFTEPPVEGGMP
ncbi:MAG: Trehalose/maltose import ATP-binding protein MalK [Bacteroidota bacterium]|jgi:ABC-2 type transport system ATP-binding protein